MGEFNAGRWIILIILYFFFLFLVINQIVIAANHYEIDTDAQFNDPGFGQSVINIRGTCLGSDTSQTIGFCVLTLADDPTSCSALTSCSWNFTSEKCEGFSLTLCTSLLNETTCRLARCTWNTIDVPTQASLADKASVGSIRQTINFITGINAAEVRVGVPNAFIYIFSFIFFWIPFIMLAISFWYILPFLH